MSSYKAFLSTLQLHAFPKIGACVPDTPNAWALRLERKIAELEAQRDECRTKAERRPFNKQLHTLRDMVRWLKSRAGYVERPAEVGLLEPEDIPDEERAVLKALAANLAGGV